jgi:hypothetical protein
MAVKKKGKKALSDEDILNRVGNAVREAVGFSDDNIAYKQERGLELYNRELFDTDIAKDGKSDPLKGRSKYVSPDVNERVDWLLAQKLSLLDSQTKVVEYMPTGAEDAPMAKQMTDTVNAIVRNLNSHATMLTPWLKNGLITGLGVVNVDFYEDKGWSVPQTLKGVPEEQLVELVAQEDAGDLKILNSSEEPYPAPLPPELEQQGMTPEALEQMGVQLPMLRDIKIRKRKNTWKMRITNVKPEDFFVSKDADWDQQTGGIKARLQGHKCVKARASLKEMGFDAEKVDLITRATDSMTGIAEERAKATDYDQGVSDVEDDVDVYEVYMRLDIDGDGWREHVHLTIAGDLQNAPVLLRTEEVSEIYPYAAYCPYPMPNTLFGHGIADKIGDHQQLISQITRANIDGLNRSVNPQPIANPEVVNLEDLLNPHPGKIIRSSDPTNGLTYMNVPFNGGPSMQFVESLKQTMDSVTGVGASMTGMSATDMQSTSASAISQQRSAMQLIIESSTRFFADTGYRFLFRIIVDQLVSKPEGAQALITRLFGSYTPIKIDDWDPSMDMSTTVAFGMMNKDFNQAMLEKIIGMQTQAVQSQSALASEQNIYNATVAFLENAGFKNTAAFVNDPSKSPDAGQKKPEKPSEAEIMAEAQKADTEAKAADAKQKRELELLKLQMEDDRERDKMAMDFELRKAEIQAKYAAQVDVAGVQAQVSAHRDSLQQGFADIAAMQPQTPPQQQAPQMPPQA